MVHQNNFKNNKMSELKEEHLVYMSDDMYTPIHYKGMIVKQPFFQGKGNHSVAQLEEICEKFAEYTHQQAIIKQNCMKHIVELKFGVSFPIINDNINNLDQDKAATWFANKNFNEQFELSDKYMDSRNPSTLTIDEVFEMWRFENKMSKLTK